MKLLGLDSKRMEVVNQQFLKLEESLKGVGAIDFANFEFIEDNDSNLVAQDKRGNYLFFAELHLKFLAFEASALNDAVDALRQTAHALEMYLEEQKESEAAERGAA